MRPIAILFCCAALGAGEAKQKPLMRDFVGLNAHFQFKPELYRPICRLLRMYHSTRWDFGQGQDRSQLPPFPVAANKVNWDKHVYGTWIEAGYRPHASIQFFAEDGSHWRDADAFAYGKAFAACFGPSHRKLVEAAEIGNEPHGMSDEAYRRIFVQMAQGLRAGDPELPIATCTAAVEPTKYSKRLSLFEDLGELYDIINVHKYPQVEGWPTWRRSFPEDPAIDFLERMRRVIAWRDEHAPGKQIWVTEFGYDACTEQAARKPRRKSMERWVGVNDTQQAQWIVRAFLVLAGFDLDRAYLYFFNDGDAASLHACAGLTRNFEPKPSFHAMAHFFGTLKDYRLARKVAEQADRSVYEFVHEDGKKKIWVAWRPVGDQEIRKVTLTGLPGKVTKAERMPLEAGDPPALATKPKGDGVELQIGPAPVYLHFAD